ncbi:MAG: uncharacterized protein KVP18_004373 [Porospora cf. gigantea A]|uniref:uncharacterized protein n=1 Tax=Porospora cf. gigantea A TaxID=2853593 RepID=UPI00355A86BA|nr:MAG: hypothetical protein KVP18_004373 [Porospora cf. gigantea A]
MQKEKQPRGGNTSESRARTLYLAVATCEPADDSEDEPTEEDTTSKDDVTVDLDRTVLSDTA